MSILLIISYVLSTAFGLILLKLGTNSGLPISIVENAIKFNINIYTVFGMILYGVSFFLYIYLLSKFELGFIIPLTTALVYILIFVASYFIFHETFTVIKIMAISLIIFGVILLSAQK